MNKLEELQKRYLDVVRNRDWEKFHNPKNLVMALSSEVGELADLFLWATGEDSKNILNTSRAQKVKDEIGDVFLYLVRLCDELNIDPFQCASEKLTKSESKYPVEQCKGISKKYNEL